MERLQDFLNSNLLTINMKKTKLTETMIKQKRGRTPGSPPKLTVQLEDSTHKTIRDEKFCRVLYLNIQDNLMWQSHLEAGSRALLP